MHMPHQALTLKRRAVQRIPFSLHDRRALHDRANDLPHLVR